LVQIEYLPWEKIVIHDVIEKDKDTFFKEIMTQFLAQNLREGSVYWHDGIAFAVIDFMDTEDTVREKLNGIIHYTAVRFTRLEQYQMDIQTTVEGARFKVNLVTTDNENLREVAKWLKNFKKNGKLDFRFLKPEPVHKLEAHRD
jgi:hypothetical protein